MCFAMRTRIGAYVIEAVRGSFLLFSTKWDEIRGIDGLLEHLNFRREYLDD